MQKLLIICFLSIIFFGCNFEQSVQDSIETRPIFFDFKNDKRNIHSTSLIKNVDVIFLGNDILVGEINKIIANNSYLYLLDRKGYSVYIYDTLGNFVHKINDFGRAGNQ